MLKNTSINKLKAESMTLEIARADSKELYALYCVDLMMMAMGPVHHSIDLFSARNSRYCGKLSCNIFFTQVRDTKIELVKVKAKIFDTDANVSHQAHYNIHFNVITFNEVYRST